MIAIYSIQNLENGKIYIGCSTNYVRRKAAHKRELRNNEHHNPILQKDWNTYNEKMFVFSILEELKSNEEKDYKECKWIQFFKDKKYELYNIYAGGCGVNWLSKGEDHHNFGKVGYWAGKIKPKEICKKVSESLKGHSTTVETRLKMSEAKKGKSPSNKVTPTPEMLEDIKGGITGTEFTKKYGYSNNLIKRIRKELRESGGMSESKTSEYVGVTWDKSRNKWKAFGKVDGKSKNLGRFNTEEEAYQATRIN